MPSRPLLILSAAPNPRPISLPTDYRQRVLRQFEERAAKYDAQGGNYHVPLANQLLELAALQRGEAALDVGAGTGFVALPAAAAVGPSGSVTAVDLSAAMLDQAADKAAQAGLTNLTCLVGDADACDFAPSSFDAILCSSALPFLPDIPAALARWRRWLRPAGRAAFNVPKGVGSQAFTVFAAVAAEHGLLLSDPSQAFANEAAVRALLAAAGYASCELRTTAETNRRPGATAEQWAAWGWAACLGMPFADLPALVGEAELEAMRGRYVALATELAQGFVAADGIAEPYEMLWVLARR